jgi:hypothetical protein
MAQLRAPHDVVSIEPFPASGSPRLFAATGRQGCVSPAASQAQVAERI